MDGAGCLQEPLIEVKDRRKESLWHDLEECIRRWDLP